MSWAEVKKINSDLSKPLNELFEDSFRFFSTSDNLDVLEVVPDNETIVPMSNGGKEIFRKTVQYGGTLRLGVTLRAVFDKDAALRVYVNSDIVSEMLSGDGQSDVRVYSAVFGVNKGDTVSLVLGVAKSAPTDTVSAKKIYFLGRIGLGGSAFANE